MVIVPEKSFFATRMKNRIQGEAADPRSFALVFSVCVLWAISFGSSIAEAEPSPEASTQAAKNGLAGNCPMAQEALALVQRRYDGVADFRAEFEQRTRAVVLAGTPESMEGVSRGEVVFAKPGRMRWRYKEPEPSEVISNGETLWIYDIGASQVTRMAMDEGYLAGAALQLLLGGGRLGEVFEVSPLSCGEQSVEIELVPKEPSSYEKLALTADSETGLVTSTTVVDLFGNRTTIVFSGVEVNTSPESQFFEFTIPEGVDALDLSERR